MKKEKINYNELLEIVEEVLNSTYNKMEKEISYNELLEIIEKSAENLRHSVNERVDKLKGDIRKLKEEKEE